MARVKKELVLERETFVRDTFRAEPTKTVKEVNQLLKDKYGQTMGLGRLYTLRRETVVLPAVTFETIQEPGGEVGTKVLDKTGAVG